MHGVLKFVLAFNAMGGIPSTRSCGSCRKHLGLGSLPTWLGSMAPPCCFIGDGAWSREVEAIRVDEDVVGSSTAKSLEKQIRQLERVPRNKVLENDKSMSIGFPSGVASLFVHSVAALLVWVAFCVYGAAIGCGAGITP